MRRLVSNVVFLPRSLGISQRKLARLSARRLQREVQYRGVGTHLVDEYQAPRIDAADLSMRQSALKNSSLSALPLWIFFFRLLCGGVLPLGKKPSLRSLSLLTLPTRTRPSGSG